MKEETEEKEGPTAESVLSPQLGSDPVDMVKGVYDARRLSKINEIEAIWMTHFLLVPKEDGGEYARAFVLNKLNLAMSDGGWRANLLIKAIQGAKGVAAIGEIAQKPGWIGRHVTQRDWKEKAEQEGKTIVE